MSIIWWTLYIIGAITIVIVWINLLTIFIKGCNVILKKEWTQVKVIEGPPGPQGPPGETGGFVITKDMALLVEGTVKNVMRQQGPMSRKDIEAFIRMEINAQLSKIQQKEDK